MLGGVLGAAAAAQEEAKAAEAPDTGGPFQDSVTEDVGFPSSWQKRAKTVTKHAQTDPVAAVSMGVQARLVADKELQTDPIRYEVPEPDNPSEVTGQGVVAFLQAVAPMVEAALERNVTSSAFDGYSAVWEDQIDSISLVHDLKHMHDSSDGHVYTGDDDDEDEHEHTGSATMLTWNCKGSLLAATFGHLDHESWCTHIGHVAVWSVFRRSAATPSVTIETGTCLTAAAFHPSNPHLLMVGGFTGRLFLYDVEDDDNDEKVVAKSSYSEDAHVEAINGLYWVPTESVKRSRLVSAGADGRAVIWNVARRAERSYQLLPLAAFDFHAKGDGGPLTGVTAVSFSEHEKNVFLAGTEGGRVFKCDLGTAVERRSKKEEVPSVNPVQFQYEPHTGPVNSLSVSSAHRHLFLSAACDTQIRLYSVLKQKALMQINPSSAYVFSLEWSRSRPSVFAAGTGDGQVLFFDTMKSRIRPAATMDVAGKDDSVQWLQFNPQSASYFATADSSGAVKLWKLPDLLTRPHPREDDMLEFLATGVVPKKGAALAAAQRAKEEEEERAAAAEEATAASELNMTAGFAADYHGENPDLGATGEHGGEAENEAAEEEEDANPF